MAARVRCRRAGRICRGGLSLPRWARRWRRRRGGGICWRRLMACVGAVRIAGEPLVKTEAGMSGQLALVIDSETVAASAVWEGLPSERQREVTMRLAHLLAKLLEAERDE